MEPTHVLNKVQSLFGREPRHTICGRYSVVIRDGGLIRSTPDELEAGDLMIIPPSTVTAEYPSRGYIQGCIEKCWPQIKDLKL